MKIIESPHEWPKTRYSQQPMYYFYFLHAFLALKTDTPTKTPTDRPPHPFYVSRLWYCDVTQTSIVTSFWQIVFRTFLTRPFASSRHRQDDYHSLIIESDSVVKRVLLVCWFVRSFAGKIARALQRECSFSSKKYREQYREKCWLITYSRHKV